jgi:hypothetical protein
LYSSVNLEHILNNGTVNSFSVPSQPRVEMVIG